MGYLTITRKQTGEADKVFKFYDYEISSLSDNFQSNKIRVDFPSDDDTEDNAFSLDLGMDVEIDFSFTLFKQDLKRDGTSENLKTYAQIIPYLKRTMFKRTIGEVLFKIEVTTKFETISAYYEFDNFSMDTDSDIYPKGKIKFKFRKYVA